MDTKTCLDKNCPVHGQVSVRGKALQGIVVKKKAQKTAVIQMEKIGYIRKYERYMKKTVKLPVHCPDCMDISIGDIVLVGETRKLSKTKSFVILKKLGTLSHMEDIIKDDKYEGIEEDNDDGDGE
jgi:small subunit ribosomal protein S17